MSSRRRVNNDSPIMRQPYRSPLLFEGRWSSNLCNLCSDVPTTAFAFLCYPCFTCCLAANAKECGLTILGTGGTPGLAMIRSKIRGRYKIEGTLIEDFVYSQCCPCCVALQLHNELISRGEISKL